MLQRANTNRLNETQGGARWGEVKPCVQHEESCPVELYKIPDTTPFEPQDLPKVQGDAIVSGRVCVVSASPRHIWGRLVDLDILIFRRQGALGTYAHWKRELSTCSIRISHAKTLKAMPTDTINLSSLPPSLGSISR